uniref:Uncharacterized protein n=1 Tax=Brassica oleracea var. oleracea TaxID=109376 RepID=A0A0D3A950_BRAOL
MYINLANNLKSNQSSNCIAHHFIYCLKPIALYFRRLTCKLSQKSFRSEKPAYQIQILKTCISKKVQMA